MLPAFSSQFDMPHGCSIETAMSITPSQAADDHDLNKCTDIANLPSKHAEFIGMHPRRQRQQTIMPLQQMLAASALT